MARWAIQLKGDSILLVDGEHAGGVVARVLFKGCKTHVCCLLRSVHFQLAFLATFPEHGALSHVGEDVLTVDGLLAAAEGADD